VTKRARWMPWQSEAMKDVVACEKLRGGGKQPVIRRCLNGETHLTTQSVFDWVLELNGERPIEWSGIF